MYIYIDRYTYMYTYMVVVSLILRAGACMPKPQRSVGRWLGVTVGIL